MQEELKARIKAWLKASGQDRDWLAAKCGVRKRTIDNWLSSPQEIPYKAVTLIDRLMAENETEAPDTPPIAPDNLLILRVSEPRFDAYNRAALAEQMPIKEWAINALDNAAAEISNPGAAKNPAVPFRYPPTAPSNLRVAETPEVSAKTDPSPPAAEPAPRE